MRRATRSLTPSHAHSCAERAYTVHFFTCVQIVIEGEAGDKFYIIKEGEAVVFQTGPDGRQHKVNHLFRADFFGERALLAQEPRMATVSAPNSSASTPAFLVVAQPIKPTAAACSVDN